MDAIRTEALTKYYGRIRGMENVSLTVERGQLFGLIGPNGAGKSTLIRTLLGLVRPTAGRAQMLGLDTVKDRERILARTGYLPAEPAFWPGMRVRDVLRLSAELRGMDCGKAAERLCRRLELDPSRRADQLSLGNKKKTAIVCALQHEPELLIADEPTSGLDPLMQREFFALLSERRAAGATVFLSSHVLSEVQRHCSHAAVIRQGGVIAAGAVEQLIHTGARRVSIRGCVCLEGLDGVRDERVTDEGADFLYSGDMDALLAALARGQIQDLAITEPTLEEVFLHYYGKGGAENDARPA